MAEYTYADFLATLDGAGQRVAEALKNHMAQNYAEYSAHGVLPKSSAKEEWSLHFRKHPKHGKPICSLFSSHGMLSIRFMFYAEMVHEVLLRLAQFGEPVRAGLSQACRCTGCGAHGDKRFCFCQHHFFIKHQLRISCNTAWFTIDDITDGRLSGRDIGDLLHLCDLQSTHMSHSARESRGAMHEEENQRHFSAPQIVSLAETALDIDTFNPADDADAKRLDKYAGEYSLTPMGAGDGLWYYLDEKAVCGTPDEGYNFTVLPAGRYAVTTVSNPFTFSAVRTWDFLCLWMRKNGMTVTSVDIGGAQTPMLARFFKRENNQCMEMLVPIKSAD